MDVDSRLSMMAFEKLNHNSQNLYTDIETMVCNVLALLDAQATRKAFYVEITDIFKGVKLKSEHFNQLMLELAKGPSSL